MSSQQRDCAWELSVRPIVANIRREKAVKPRAERRDGPNRPDASLGSASHDALGQCPDSLKSLSFLVHEMRMTIPASEAGHEESHRPPLRVFSARYFPKNFSWDLKQEILGFEMI